MYLFNLLAICVWLYLLVNLYVAHIWLKYFLSYPQQLIPCPDIIVLYSYFNLRIFCKAERKFGFQLR